MHSFTGDVCKSQSGTVGTRYEFYFLHVLARLCLRTKMGKSGMYEYQIYIKYNLICHLMYSNECIIVQCKHGPDVSLPLAGFPEDKKYTKPEGSKDTYVTSKSRFFSFLKVLISPVYTYLFVQHTPRLFFHFMKLNDNGGKTFVKVEKPLLWEG